MVPICRSAPFLLPGVEKALPSRQPETQADKNATAMMGHPLRQIQQGPAACPSCGRNHRAGTVCFNKGIDVLDALFAKGVITISGQKRGNPYRDDGTGRFAASPNAGGGGGGGAATQENTVMGAARAPQAPAGDIGTAKTQEGPAPNVSGAAPAPAMESAGPKTMPGKEPIKNQTGISPSMIARHEAQQKEDQGFLDAFLNRNKDAAGAGPKPVFSHQGAQEAYEGEKARMMGQGASNEEAHAAGMKAGGAAYAQAIRDPNAPPAAAKPAAPMSPGSGAPTTQGGAATVQSPAPTMSGAAPAPAAGGGPASGGAPSPAAPASPAAAPGGAPGASPGGGGAGNPNVGNPKGAGAKKPPSLLDELSKPWSAAGGSIGAGMFTPGGTVGGTNAGVTGSAHGLLSYAKQDKPASTQHQQQVKNAQGRSGFMQNQQAQQQGNMRQFAGAMGAAGGGQLPGGGGSGAAPAPGGAAQAPAAAPRPKTPTTMGRTP